MAIKYMSFEEVLNELQIDEDELKKLVSQGELRGWRDGRSMKFKTDDVLSLKQGRETEPTIILTDSDQEMGIAESSDELILEDSTSDTVINIGDIMGGTKSDQQEIVFDTTEEFTVSPNDSDPERAIPTVEVPSVSEDVGFEETESDAALVEVGSHDLSDSAIEITSSSVSTETEAFELMEESGETEDFVAQVRPSGRSRTSSRRQSSSVRMRALSIQKQHSSGGWTVAMVLLLIAPLVLQGGILFEDVASVQSEWVGGLTGWARSMVDGIFVSLVGK